MSRSLLSSVLFQIVLAVWGSFGVAAGLVSACRELGSDYRGSWVRSIGWLWIAFSGAVLVFWAVVP